MSKILVDTIDTRSGTTTLTLGSSNAGTIALGSGDVQSNFLQPYFSAYISSTQTVLENTAVKAQFDTELVDSDGAFDNSTNYRFTVPSGKAGKYFISADLTAISDTQQLRDLKLFIYKNGSSLTGTESRVRYQSTEISRACISTTSILDLSASDYIEIYGQLDTIGGSTRAFDGGKCRFTGFRIGS